MVLSSVRMPPYQALCTTDRSVNSFFGEAIRRSMPANEFCAAVLRKRLPDMITGVQGTTNLPSRFKASANGVSSAQYMSSGKPPVALKASRVQNMKGPPVKPASLVAIASPVKFSQTYDGKASARLNQV